MTERATQRLFDGEGNLVVAVGEDIPEGRSDLKPLQVKPADTLYPAGKPGGDTDPVDEPMKDAVTEVPVHTPAEQQLVDAGLMKSRDAAAGGVSSQSAKSKK